MAFFLPDESSTGFFKMKKCIRRIETEMTEGPKPDLNPYRRCKKRKTKNTKHIYYTQNKYLVFKFIKIYV